MGFLSNLIGGIKNKFSDDEGIFQKNKFVGFGGGNNFAKSQLDLGNSNLPLSSTQRPTFQQFKPQIEEPIEQPKLNTTSSIENLKNRIKAIQGLNNIQIKDPVPQIQPPQPTFMNKVNNVASNVMGGVNKIGNNISKGVNDQVNIQKRDFNDFVVNPLINTPGQNLGEGTFGRTIYEEGLKPLGRWAKNTGEVLASKKNQELETLRQDEAVTQKILWNKINTAKKYREMGDIESAIKLENEVKQNLNQPSRFDKFITDLESEKNQYKSDAMKTAMTVAGAGSAFSNPLSLMLPTAIGGIFGAVGGKDFGQAAGEGFVNAVRWKAVTQFTDPAIGRTVNQFVKSSFAPIARQLSTRFISGTGNIIEDRIIDGLEGKQRGIWDDVVSFGIGALLSNGGKGVTNWSQWKKDFSKNWTKDVSESFKLDPNDAKLVEKTVGSVLDKVNKYVTSPEGMKMRQGFVTIPFGPEDTKVDAPKPEAPKVDMANQPKDADTALKLFQIAKSEGITDEKFLRERLRTNGYDISKIPIKGEPLPISKVLDKHNLPEKPIELSVSGQKVPVEDLKIEGWDENQIYGAMKKLERDGGVPDGKIDSWIRKALKDENPNAKVGRNRNIPLPPEPSAEEIARMDRNVIDQPIKTEPKFSEDQLMERNAGIELPNNPQSVKQNITQTIKVSDLPDRATAIGMPHDKYEIMAADIKKNGIINPIVIDKKTGQVLDGMHRAFVAERLGLEEIPVKYVDGSKITLDDARKIGGSYNEHLKRANEKYLDEHPQSVQPIKTGEIKNPSITSNRPDLTNEKLNKGFGEIDDLHTIDPKTGKLISKTEPQVSKVTTQEPIVNPRASGEVTEPKKISDLGSKSKKVTPISEIKPKTETPKVEQPKVETDNKFAGEEARLKYKNVDSSTIKNKKLASAVAQAKKLDQWEVNKNAIKSRVADDAWKKVAAIENGTWKEEKITLETITRDIEEGKKQLDRLIGKINQSETQAFDYAERSGLTDIKSEDTDKIINAIENTKVDGEEYSPEDIANIEKTKEFWSRALAIGKKLGLKINETKNYFTHMYAEFQGSNMSGSKNLNQKTPFANSRKYSSYKQAFEEAGLTKAFNNIAEFGTRYMQKNLTTRAKIDFLASLPFKNIQDIKGLDYKLVNKIPGVDIGENDRYLPSKLADMVNGYFADENVFKTVEKTARIAKFFQDIKLNAGIPFTPANYYGIVQGFKEFQTELGQIVTLKKSPLQTHTFKNFARSFSRNASIEWEKKQVKSIIKMKSVFKLDGQHNLKDMLEGGVWDSIKDKKFGEAINKAMGDATFKRFMFQNMVSTFNESEARFMKDGMDEKTATKTALTLVEKLYGLQRVQAKYTGSNLEKFLGNKNVSNILQTMLMAKDYKQQMSKMWWNMAKAIKNPSAPENQGVVAYGVGLIATKIAMEAANIISTGKLMEQNPENLKDKSIIGLPGSKSGLTLQSIPGTGFVPKTLFKIGKSMVTGKGDVGKQVGSFASIPVGLISDLSSNEDYFGNNIWDSADTTGDKAKKVAEYSMQEVISPYITGLKSLTSILKKKDAGNPEDIKDSEINDLLKAVEFPMSYISKDRFETLHYYDNKKEQYDKLTEDEKVIFDKIEKKETDFGSKQRDAVADAQDLVNYPNVLNAKREIAIKTAKENGVELDPLYKLTDEQLKTYYQIQGLKNNRTAQKTLKDDNEWYSELTADRSKYFDDLIASGKMKEQESDYPKASPETQKKIDYLTALKTPEIKKKQDYYYTLPKGTGARSAYIKANPDLLNYWNVKNAYNENNPDIQAFWDEVNAYNVKVDEAFGIKAEEDTTGSGSGGSGWQNWEKTPPNVYTYLNKITGGRKSTLKKDINSIIKLSKKDTESKELAKLISKTHKSLSEIFNNKKHK